MALFKPRRAADPYRWHDWFAWYPIYVDNDEVRGLFWLETVRRCRIQNFGGSWWEYQIYD